jgi:2-phosphosulfolactate phosphatase
MQRRGRPPHRTREIIIRARPPSQEDHLNVTVVIDAFRAFATAAYILHQRPREYLLTTTSASARRLATADPDALLVGKPEIGALVSYDIPNSPTRVAETRIANRRVVHRTEAGARGVLAANGVVLVAAFVNARATAAWLRRTRAHVRLWPMGHQAASPALEDDLCAACIESLLVGRTFDLLPHREALRDGPGRYFFDVDQWQYPREDFDRCLELDRFDFAIQAEVRGDYARLSAIEPS